MPFDMGFNFRSTAGFVTDQAYAVPVLLENYPHTYTNGNGNSINAGWTVSNWYADRVNTNDPRLAGMQYSATGTTMTFEVDLASGSAPGAGTYTIDLAAGDAGQGSDFTTATIVRDTSTTLITLSGSVASGHYFDATGADVAATTTWTGATVSKTFATTLCYFDLRDNGTAAKLAHFRLTLQGGASGFGPLLSTKANRLVLEI